MQETITEQLKCREYGKVVSDITIEPQKLLKSGIKDPLIINSWKISTTS